MKKSKDNIYIYILSGSFAFQEGESIFKLYGDESNI